MVLLGLGHTNLHALRMWRGRGVDDARLVCVSNFPTVTYSGMLPGVLAGQYSPKQMEIDLRRLCEASGAELIVDEVERLDVAGRELHFVDRSPLPFDALSVGIGSVPSRGGAEVDETVLSIKPMQNFVRRFDQRLTDAAARSKEKPVRIVIVGAGAAGVEMTLCIPRRVQVTLPGRRAEMILVDGAERVGRGLSPRSRRLIRRELESRGVEMRTGERVTRVADHRITLGSGETIHSDIVLWATDAIAPPLLSRLELPKDEYGFLLTDNTLRSTADAPIFAVGDAGQIVGEHYAKAGAIAVKQGPILLENLRRTLVGGRLKRFTPQQRFLKILNFGDGRAVAEYQGLSCVGGWCWRLKNAIDLRFIEQYRVPESV